MKRKMMLIIVLGLCLALFMVLSSCVDDSGRETPSDDPPSVEIDGGDTSAEDNDGSNDDIVVVPKDPDMDIAITPKDPNIDVTILPGDETSTSAPSTEP